MSERHILVQGEGVPQVAVLPCRDGTTVAEVKQQLTTQFRGLQAAELLVFQEDAENPLGEAESIPLCPDGHIRVHVHRCRQVCVTVKFAGQAADRRFSPAVTIAQIKRWAALKAFHLNEEDASEHVLQIAGTVTRPDADTHVGALVHCPACAIVFDLITIERINGAEEDAIQ